MGEFSDTLRRLESGESSASEQLLELAYDELRRVAARQLAQETPGQTLQPTALVHEAYLRLVGDRLGDDWEGRRHFVAAASEAMRRILIERARRRATLKRGGELRRMEMDVEQLVDDERTEELLSLDEALTELERHDGQAAQLVKLRYFAGLTHEEAADLLGVSRRAADRLWALAKAWLYRRLHGD